MDSDEKVSTFEVWPVWHKYFWEDLVVLVFDFFIFSDFFLNLIKKIFIFKFFLLREAENI